MNEQQRPKPFSMIREFHLADWITLGNAVCGVGALFAVMSYLRMQDVLHLYFACGLIPAALVFDVLDGRVARWRQKTSAMGRELDSLADVISFGVAPAVIGYAAGLRGGWDRALLIAFVACGVGRLARYNVTAEALAAGADKVPYFEGAPIPTSLWLTGVLAILAATGRVQEAMWLGRFALGPFDLHPLSLLFAVQGALMVSKTLHIPKP